MPIEVLCEVIYVLTGYYEIDRQSVGTRLKRFFERTKCTLPNDTVDKQIAIRYAVGKPPRVVSDVSSREPEMASTRHLGCAFSRKYEPPLCLFRA